MPCRECNAAVARMKINASADLFGDGIESLPECNLFQIKVENGIRIAHLICNNIGGLLSDLSEDGFQRQVLALDRRQVRSGLLISQFC